MKTSGFASKKNSPSLIFVTSVLKIFITTFMFFLYPSKYSSEEEFLFFIFFLFRMFDNATVIDMSAAKSNCCRQDQRHSLILVFSLEQVII
jgi:hypothetical protein